MGEVGKLSECKIEGMAEYFLSLVRRFFFLDFCVFMCYYVT